MTSKPEKTLLFRADEIDGKDIDNLLKEGTYTIQAARIQDGKLVSGEPNLIPFKTEVFSVSQTTAEAVNVISGIAGDTAIGAKISTWLGVPVNELKDFVLHVYIAQQFLGDAAGTDAVETYLDGLGGSAIYFKFINYGNNVNGQFPYAIFFPTSDGSKSFDLLFTDCINWGAGETHNLDVTIEAYRNPSNVGTTPHRALV